MSNRNVITFDIGTQSTRALIINDHGEIIGKKQIKHDPPYESPQPGWAEKDANDYYKYICKVSLALKEELPLEFEKIEAVSITCIRDTIINLDGNNEPLRPSILWLDDRKTSSLPELPASSKLVFKAIKFTEFVNLQYQKSPCNWIKDNQPDIWEKTKKVMLLSGYITFCLTGNITDAVACCVGHIPFDVKTRNWMDNKALTRPIFNIPNDMLPQLTESCQEMGRITAKASNDTGLKEGLPIIATGSDKACEIIGLGCQKKEQAAISFGTTSTISFNIPNYFEAEQFLPPYPSVIKGEYNPEYELYRGYWLVSWFRNQFAQDEAIEAAKQGKSVEDILNEGLKDIPCGSEGLFLSPYFTADISQPYARGGFIGLADYHTKKHMYRATIEGINFALLEGLKRIEQRGKFTFKEIRLGGGGSQSDIICQITADMFGIPVIRTHTFESAGLGSAMASFVGIGVYKDFNEATEHMVREGRRFEPNKDNFALYIKLFEVYKKIYPQLMPVYKSLSEIYH